MSMLFRGFGVAFFIAAMLVSGEGALRGEDLAFVQEDSCKGECTNNAVQCASSGKQEYCKQVNQSYGCRCRGYPTDKSCECTGN